jgi:bacterioferritin-associated ferredoxin
MEIRHSGPSNCPATRNTCQDRYRTATLATVATPHAEILLWNTARVFARKPGMIVCSCTMITSKDVAEAVAALRTKDPFVVLTPGLIYRHLGVRPSCGSCLPLITKLMVGYDEEGPSSAASVPHRSRFEEP